MGGTSLSLSPSCWPFRSLSYYSLFLLPSSFPCFGLPQHIPTQLDCVPIHFIDYLPVLHCLYICLLPFSLTSSSLLSYAVSCLSSSLPDSLHLRITISCTLWKASSKIFPTILSLRAVSQGILLFNSLKSWKCAFLKFRVQILHFSWPISLRTANSPSAWSLQPRLLPTLTFQTGSWSD